MKAKLLRHYWKLGMPAPQAQRYSQDICGSESENYTEHLEEVTCERCLAALRASSGSTGDGAAADVPGSPPAEAPGHRPQDPALADAVRGAVVSSSLTIIAERERDVLAALHAEVVAEAERLKALLQSVVDRAHEEALREARRT